MLEIYGDAREILSDVFRNEGHFSYEGTITNLPPIRDPKLNSTTFNLNRDEDIKNNNNNNNNWC